MMVYQDHLAKFVQLRILTSKRVAEVAIHLTDIFCTFGASAILQSPVIYLTSAVIIFLGIQRPSSGVSNVSNPQLWHLLDYGSSVVIYFSLTDPFYQFCILVREGHGQNFQFIGVFRINTIDLSVFAFYKTLLLLTHFVASYD